MTANHVTPIRKSLRQSPHLGGKKELGTVLPLFPTFVRHGHLNRMHLPKVSRACSESRDSMIREYSKWSASISHWSVLFHHKMSPLSQAQKKCLTSGADKARAIVLKLEILGSKSAISILRGRHDSNGWWDFPARGVRQHLTYLTQLL